MKIIQAQLSNLEETAELFDKYRIFYKQNSNLTSARKFIKERLRKKDSIIFLISEEKKIIGFCQIYPSYSSVAMKQIYILNDLYIEPQYRQKGAAKALLLHAKNYTKENKVTKIVLKTAIDNIAAQNLYQKLGYVADREFVHYIYEVK